MCPHNLLSNLRALDVAALPISQYSRGALKRVLDYDSYYLDIYQLCMEAVCDACGKRPEEMTVVDYGGGHGLFSMAAKVAGFAKVVYIDINPDSETTVRVLSASLGFAPDVILQGDSDVLADWCIENRLSPDALVAVDVIEHIYNLDVFFSSMNRVSNSMAMVFTTASTPCNPMIKRRLHRIMMKDELSGDMSFLKQRHDYIRGRYTSMDDDMLDYWASNTRGLTFGDINKAIAENRPNRLDDSYNTCDPATGSWTERILPLEDYQDAVDRYGLVASVAPGFYNGNQSSLKGILCRLVNRIMCLMKSSPQPVRGNYRLSFKLRMSVAPFIYIFVTKKN